MFTISSFYIQIQQFYFILMLTRQKSTDQEIYYCTVLWFTVCADSKCLLSLLLDKLEIGSKK
jgi:hypothetical protein